MTYIRKQPAVIVCSLQPKAILNLQDFHAYSIQFLVWIIMVFEGYVWDRMRGVTAEACDVGGCPQILLMAALVAGMQLPKGHMIKCFLLHFAQKKGSRISLVLLTFHRLGRSEPVFLHSGCAIVATS